MKQRVQINEFDKNIVQHNKYHTNKKQTSSSHHFFAKKSHKFRKLRFTFFFCIDPSRVHSVQFVSVHFSYHKFVLSLFFDPRIYRNKHRVLHTISPEKKSNWRKIQKIINNKHTQNPSRGFSKLCWFFFFVLLIFYHKPSRL